MAAHLRSLSFLAGRALPLVHQRVLTAGTKSLLRESLRPRCKPVQDRSFKSQGSRKGEVCAAAVNICSHFERRQYISLLIPDLCKYRTQIRSNQNWYSHPATAGNAKLLWLSLLFRYEHISYRVSVACCSHANKQLRTHPHFPAEGDTGLQSCISFSRSFNF